MAILTKVQIVSIGREIVVIEEDKVEILLVEGGGGGGGRGVVFLFLKIEFPQQASTIFAHWIEEEGADGKPSEPLITPMTYSLKAERAIFERGL
jgi:hypothetical protein